MKAYVKGLSPKDVLKKSFKEAYQLSILFVKSDFIDFKSSGLISIPLLI